MIGQSNHDEQTENRENMLCGGTSSDNASNPTRINYPQVYVHTLKQNIIIKLRSEEDNVMKSFETRVQDAVLTAIENLVIPRVELAMKSANLRSERNVDGNVLKPHQKDFLGNIEGLQMTASSGRKFHRDINRIDETRGNITVEEGDLLVNKKNIDQQTHAHHSNSKISAYLDCQHKPVQEVTTTKVMQNKNLLAKKTLLRRQFSRSMIMKTDFGFFTDINLAIETLIEENQPDILQKTTFNNTTKSFHSFPAMKKKYQLMLARKKPITNRKQMIETLCEKHL